jgi:hypothetical protein
MVRFSIKSDHINITRIRDSFFSPVLAPVMQSRWVIALLGAASVFQITLTAMGLTAWQCPLKSNLGLACPGCGLTRAVVLLAQGQWQAAIQSHAFAPIALGAGLLLAAGGLLPTRLRHMAAEHLAAFERRTGMVVWLMLSALIYWLGRMMIHN